MTLDTLFSLDIIETMENYISKVRPKPEIRNRLDLAYEINGQSVILNEVRPRWNNPEEIITSGYAKATYIKPRFRIRNLLNFIFLQSKALTPILYFKIARYSFNPK